MYGQEHILLHNTANILDFPLIIGAMSNTLVSLIVLALANGNATANLEAGSETFG